MTLPHRKALALGAIGLTAIGLASCSTTDTADDAGTTSESEATSTEAEAATDDSTAEATDSEATDSEEQAATDSEYEDGTYTASGSYTSPGGQETIDVTITIEDDVITAVTVDNPDTTNANSLRYQQEFIDGIAAEVVGVSIDEISVDRVGGSSLTSGGFNDALETIKDEAAL